MHFAQLITDSLCLSLSAAAAVSQPAGSDALAFVSIVTYSDILKPGDGVPILIEDPTTGNSALTTDGSGQTEFVPSSLGATLVVTLGEQPAPEGQLLGQRRVVTMPWYGDPSDETYLLHQTTQPLAMPFTWPPPDGEDSVTADPYHTRWTLRTVLNNPESVEFSGLAAPLLTRQEIDSLLWYNAAPTSTDQNDFRVGTVLRTDFVDLPSAAFTLEIDCRGHGFVAPPAASCIILASSPQADPPTLSAQVVWWHNEIAYVWLDGELEAGDNMVLLSPGPSGEAMLAVSELVPHEVGQQAALPLSGSITADQFEKSFNDNAGSAFVRALREAGGWELVDRAFLDPPQRTAEILHLPRYLEQTRKSDEDALFAAWRLSPFVIGEYEQLGAYDIQHLLARSEATRPRAAQLAASVMAAKQVADPEPIWIVFMSDLDAARAMLEAVWIAGATKVEALSPDQRMVSFRPPAGLKQ